jgi:protein O-mannosyl-transferase
MARRLARFGPVVAALLLYAPSLRFDRTFDDRYHIPDPSESPRHTFGQVWTSRYWEKEEGGGLYRPVTSTTYWIEGKLHAPLPARHAVNVLLFALVTWLVVLGAGALGLPVWAAGLAGLLFALHPVHVESVAGLVGRAELLAALAMLLALGFHLNYLRSSRNAGRTFLAIAVLSFVAASSKESAWFLPLCALPLPAVLGRPLGRAWPAWSGYALGIGAHLVLRHHVLGGWLNAPDVIIDPSDNPLVSLHGWARLWGGLAVVGDNVRHLVLPMRLAPDYSGTHIAVTGGSLAARAVLGLAFLAGSCALVGFGFRKRTTALGTVGLVSGTWFLVSGLFFMNLFFDLGTVLADRLLFWPSIAWSLLVAAAPIPWLAAPVRSRFRLGFAGAIGGVLAVAYLGVSVRYLPEWRNDTTLFTAALQVVPESPRVWFNFGRSVQDEGRHAEALTAFRRARTMAPTDYKAWAQEATVLLQEGRWDEARVPLAEALRLNPEDAVSLVNEGVIWLQEGEAERAADRFQDVLRRHPDRTEALLNLALAEGRLGHVEVAETLWRRYLEAKPRDPDGLNNLAWLLATKRNRAAEAEPLSRQAIALNPDDPNLRDTLAEVLWRQGKTEDAARVAREALALHPDSTLDAHLHRFLLEDSLETKH